jgi:hypothetical protein
MLTQLRLLMFFDDLSCLYFSMRAKLIPDG